LDSSEESVLRDAMLGKASEIDREEGRESDIFELADEYGCSFIYGNDWHAGTGRKGDGLAIAEGDEIISQLEGGSQLPIEELKNMDVVEYDDHYLFSTDAVRKNLDYIRTFPGSAPGKAGDVLQYLFDNKTNYENLKETTLDSYEDITAEEMLENARDPRLDSPNNLTNDAKI
jgi:hypothetical protein